MSKIVGLRVIGLVLSILFTFTMTNTSFASNHTEAETEVEHIEIGNIQAEGWSNAPKPQGIDNKRLSQYAIDMQLEQNKGGFSSGEKTTFYLLISLVILLLLIVLGISSNLLISLKKISGKTSSFNYNKLNANLMLAFLFLFFGAIVYETIIHTEYILPESASLHGEDIDQMMWITLAITGIVFVLTHIALFVFAFKYQQREGQQAIYYPKNDKLELLWTSVPALVLTILVLFGFKVWVKTTITAAEEEGYEIELYAYQFDWKFRYPGPDGILGRTDYRLTNTKMPDGMPNALALDLTDPASADDIIKDELVLPKGKMVKLRMRSRDVLHSALLPHFRAQMYCVPGTPTQFNLTATYTTEEFRTQINKPEFNFELACNQICGANHYKMKRYIKVIEESEYVAWLNKQAPAVAKSETNDSNNQLTLK